MSSWKKEEVERLATLARIQLTDEEVERLSRQLPEIVGFFNQIQAVVGQTPEEEAAVVDLRKMREDEAGSGPAQLSTEEIGRLAPRFNEDTHQVATPPVFGVNDDS